MNKLPLGQRISAAMSLVFKGSIAPFNKLLGDIGGGGNGKKLSNPYEQSVWVQGCITKVAQPISAVDLLFMLETSAGETEYTDPNLTAFWKKPAKGLTGYSEFIKATIGWRKLTGQAFWLIDSAINVPFPAQTTSWPQLILARPDRMRPVVDKATGIHIGWEYTDGAMRKHDLALENVIHLKYWSPFKEHGGAAPMDAAMIAAETDYLAGQFALNLMRNNGDTGPYIVAKGGMPTDEQRQMIINQLREKRRYAQQGEFRPAFVTGDITVEDAKVQVIDANLIAARLQDRHTIAFAMGVPMSMVDLVASYSIGSASDRYALISETCIPEGDDICDGISEVARRMTGQRTLSARMNWDEHPVMQAVRRERIESAIKLWGAGKPMKNINDYLSLGMKPFPGWERGYLPFSVAPVDDLDPVTDPKLAEEDKTKPVLVDPVQVEDDIAKMRQAITAKTLGMVGRLTAPAIERDEFAAFACAHHDCKGDAGALHKARSKKEIALWRSHMSKRREAVKSYKNRFTKVLFDARAETLANLNKQKALPGVLLKAAAADILFDPVKFAEAFFATMRRQSALSLQAAGEQLYAELGLDDPWQVPPAEVLQFNKLRENKLKDVPDDIFQQVKSEIEAGLNAGESIAKLTDRIKGTFNDISRERAERIAMTETAAVYGQGRQVAMESAGVEYKEWLTSGNDNVRATHAAANNQRVKIDEPFTVGGEKLMSPGDPNGSAANVINCHCVSIAVEATSEEQT